MLEILFTNTNDNYHYKLTERFQKSLELNLLFLKNSSYYNDVNFTIIDWGSKKKFSNSISLNKEFKNKINFIEVPTKVAEKYSKKTINFYHGAISANLGFRKSNSQFIMHMAHDQFLPSSCWNNLLTFLKSEEKKINPVIYFPRYRIDKDFLLKNKSFEDLNSYILTSNFNHNLTSQFKFNVGGGCTFVASTKQLKNVKGYTEIPDFACDFDLHLRFSNDGSTFFDGRNIGVYSFKFPTIARSQRNDLIKKNRKFYIPKDYFNKKNFWGLSQHKFTKIKLKKFTNIKYQDFEFLNDKKNSNENSFSKKLRLSKNEYVEKFRKLLLIIILYNIFKYTDCVNFINISNKNFKLGLIIQEFFKDLNVFYCSSKKYLDTSFFSKSFFDIMKFNTKIAIGKINISHLNKINSIFKNKNFFSSIVLLDDLKNKNIIRFQRYISFIIVLKRIDQKNNYKHFKIFYKQGKIAILINKHFAKKLLNKSTLLKKINEQSSKVLIYKMYIVFLYLKSLLKKILLVNY